LLISQRSHQASQWTSPTTSDELGGDPQRQRQPAALGGQRLRCTGVCLGPLADQCPQQADRVSGRQEVKVQSHGTVPSHKSSQRIPAGHDRHAGRSSGQQQPDLLHRPGVVKHDQHPLPGQQAPV
jgi:hypothetical protein